MSTQISIRNLICQDNRHKGTSDEKRVINHSNIGAKQSVFWQYLALIKLYRVPQAWGQGLVITRASHPTPHYISAFYPPQNSNCSTYARGTRQETGLDLSKSSIFSRTDIFSTTIKCHHPTYEVCEDETKRQLWDFTWDFLRHRELTAPLGSKIASLPVCPFISLSLGSFLLPLYFFPSLRLLSRENLSE